MLTNFQSKKLSYLFDFLDLNKNTLLQKDDFEGVGENICQKRDFEEDSQAYKSVLKHCVKFYNRIKEDMADDEDRISADVWVRFFEANLIEDADDLLLDEYIELFLGYIFGLTDENNDGYISREEYTDIFSTFGVSKEHAEAGFDHLDANNDNKLSRYEIKYAIETFLISDDEKDNANWILGDWQR